MDACNERTCETFSFTVLYLTQETGFLKGFRIGLTLLLVTKSLVPIEVNLVLPLTSMRVELRRC